LLFFLLVGVLYGSFIIVCCCILVKIVGYLNWQMFGSKELDGNASRKISDRLCNYLYVLDGLAGQGYGQQSKFVITRHLINPN